MTSETRRNPGESIRIEGFLHAPYSILSNPALQEVHALAQSFGKTHNERATLLWLSSLTDFSTPATPLSRRFAAVSSDRQDHMVIEQNKLTATEAVLIYSSAKLENLLRLQSVRDPEDANNGTSFLLARELSKLSNVYYARYLDKGKSHLVEVAHSLAMYAFRFKQPDYHGYRQTIGHWLHLDVDVSPHNANQFEKYEEILKLSLALTEIGSGSDAPYVKLLVQDLKKLYILKGDEEKADFLENHFKNIPSATKEPELYHQKQWEIERNKREQMRLAALHYRKPRRKRKK